jgi:hypothetical protein
MTTRVVNVRDYKPYNEYWIDQGPDSQYVYIGRFVRYQIPRGSKWGNPFAIGRNGTREEVITKYREYVLNKPELLKLIPIELKDKILGCWCKPLACHGDVLAEIADADNR